MSGAALPEAPRLAVVVLNYNSYENTVACAEAALGSRGVRPMLRVLDNASPDGSGQRLVERFDRTSVVLRPENEGYAGGMNAGIRWWLDETDADHLLLLTPDARVQPDAAAALVEAMTRFPRAGVVGPQIHYGDGFAYSVSAGGFVDGRRLRAGHYPSPRAPDPYAVDWLDGCCLLLRRAAIEEMGGFDTAYFMYYEENDLCHRLRRHGWDVLLVPGASASHRTAPLPGAHYFYYMARNSFRYWKEHHGRGYPRVAAEHAFTTARILAGATRAVVDPRRWREVPDRWRTARRQVAGVVAGSRDAALGRWGRQPR